MNSNLESKLVILIADDDENDALLLTRAIKSAELNCEIKVVSDGEQAINYLQRAATQSDPEYSPFPRVMVLDLKMPRKNGFEVLEWLRDHPEFNVVPTITFSSSQIPRDVKRAYQLGALSFFNKPSDFGELKSLFKTIIPYWQKANLPSMPTAKSNF
ncbi:MAG: response regulator [Verrucomicrobiota bacterium]